MSTAPPTTDRPAPPAHGNPVAPMSHERCDRCEAHAYVLVAVIAPSAIDTIPTNLPLAFCSHHYREHEAALVLVGARVRADIREQLLAREASAHA